MKTNHKWTDKQIRSRSEHREYDTPTAAPPTTMAALRNSNPTSNQSLLGDPPSGSQLVLSATSTTLYYSPLSDVTKTVKNWIEPYASDGSPNAAPILYHYLDEVEVDVTASVSKTGYHFNGSSTLHSKSTFTETDIGTNFVYRGLERQEPSSLNNWTETFVPVESHTGGITQSITHTKPAADNTITVPNQGTTTTVAPGGENHSATTTLSTYLTVQKPLADFVGEFSSATGYESSTNLTNGSTPPESSSNCSQTSGANSSAGATSTDGETNNLPAGQMEYDGFGPSMFWQMATKGTVFERLVDLGANLDVIRYTTGRWRTFFNHVGNDGIFSGTQSAADDFLTAETGGLGIVYRGLTELGENYGRGESLPVAYLQAVANEAFVIRNLTSLYEWYSGNEFSGSHHGNELTTTQSDGKLVFAMIGLIGDVATVFATFRAVASAARPTPIHPHDPRFIGPREFQGPPAPNTAIEAVGKFAAGVATRIRIEGDRVYALLPSNGGTGPNRWMRMSGGSTGNTTRLGVPRTNAGDWRSLQDIWDRTGVGDILSSANRQRIADGITPRVDDAWIRYFPGDSGLIDELIPMHHIQGLPLTVPLPAPRHLDAHMPGGFRFNPGGPGRSG